MPVRVKQRAVSPPNGERIDRRDLERLKARIVALILAINRPISVSLCSAIEGNRKHFLGCKDLNGSPHGLPLQNSGIGHETGAVENPFREIDASRVYKVLTQADLIDPSGSDTWVRISAHSLDINISGVISLLPVPSRSSQFISVGIKPINQDIGKIILYEEINKLFAHSSFGNDVNKSNANDIRSQSGQGLKQKGSLIKQSKAGGKGVDRWPAFCIRINLPGCNEAEKLGKETTLNNVLKVIKTMFHGFLRAHHFRTRPLRSDPRPQLSPRPTSRKSVQAISQSSPFASWSRVKSSDASRPSSGLTPNDQANDQQGKSSKNPEALEKADRQGEKKPQFVNSVGEEILEWTNPISGLVTFINSQTGLVVPRPSTSVEKPAISLPERPFTAPGRLTRRTPQGFLRPQDGTWANALLSNWKNPVFSLAEEQHIRSLAADKFNLEQLSNGPHTESCTLAAEPAFPNPNKANSTTLSKEDLQDARIVNQVDRKFILIASAKHPDLLILVDQHAADERIRFEELAQALLTTPPEVLTKPLLFEIPTREHNLLSDYAAHFRSGGIDFDLTPLGPKSSTSRLAITRLPQAIAERCRLEPGLLIKLVRGEIWRLEEKSIKPSNKAQPPPGLVEMLASRACRSAIMFNDDLSVFEAKSLIRRLARCDLPFQCAHGRPSLVPLVDLGSASVSDEIAGKGGEPLGLFDRSPAGDVGCDGEIDRGTDFVTAWKAWDGG